MIPIGDNRKRDKERTKEKRSISGLRVENDIKRLMNAGDSAVTWRRPKEYAARIAGAL